MPRKSTSFADIRENPDTSNWAARSEYWLSHKPVVRGRPKKFKYREPLILCGHAAHIRVDHGSLLVRNGFTHYPQKQEIIRIFPGDANLPDRIVMLDGSGGISFDALNWMSEQQIDFVRLDWRGEIINIAGRSGYAGNSKLILAQRAIKGTKTEIEIARHLISSKIEASIKTLKLVIPKSEAREKAISGLEQQYSEIRKKRSSPTIPRILGIEGACAAAYFKAWHGLPIKWSGIKRKPIPDNWNKIIPRNMLWRDGTRNARHPVNAMLNYGYGILTNEIRSQVIAAGLDPIIGIIHGSTKNRIPLVYDLMEPLRPVIDRAIIGFALSHTFLSGDFAINRWGGCRLNSQMAKCLATNIMSEDKDIKSVLKTFLSNLHN